MALWRFMDYYSEAGNNLIEEWYLDQSENVQADFDTTLKNLSIAPDWRGMKEFKSLKMDGLCEILFKTDGVQYRPTGSFGPGAQTFTIWIGCSKKQNVYNPPDAFEKAKKRKRDYYNKQKSQQKGTLRERIV
jgi:hypothetical protein